MSAHRTVCSGLFALSLCAAAHAAGTLVGHWRFDESGGTTAADSGPNGLHGTLAGGTPSFVPGGISGNAISIARPTNDHVNMGTIPFNGTPFTLALWIKTETASYSIIAGRHRATLVQGYFLAINAGGNYGQPSKAHAYVSTLPGGEPISFTNVNDGQWHHLMMTHVPGQNVILWIDGELESARPAPGYSASAAPFIVGGLLNSGGAPISFYDGLIDDVQLYSGKLNGRQMCQIYNNPGQSAAPNIDGDINGDGTVNFADLNLLLSSFNMTGFCMIADINNDGTADFGDLNILLSHFNQSM